MTALDEPGVAIPQPITVQPYPPAPAVKGSLFSYLSRTTDPKMIGRMYLVTSFGFSRSAGSWRPDAR